MKFIDFEKLREPLNKLYPNGTIIIGLLISLILLLKASTVYSYDVSLNTSGTFTVLIPSGVTSLIVDIWGAGGSGSATTASSMTAYAGGSGSYVHCRLAIAGGINITAIVGQGGQAPAYSASAGLYAVGGGGSGDADGAHTPGGGGGRSTIKNTTVPAADLVTAGGGGGGGIEHIAMYPVFVVYCVLIACFCFFPLTIY